MPCTVPRARVWRQPRNARAEQSCRARPRRATSRARADPVAARRRSISRDSSRASTLPPAFLRRLHPETSRHRTREPRDQCCAFCSSHYHSSSPRRRRSTNRRPTPFSSRCNLRFSSRCDLRPSPALFAPPPREINTTAPPHSTPHAHHPRSAHITMDAPRGTRMRARRSTPRSTSSPTSSPPRDTNPPSTGVPSSPAGRHACGAASVGPAAARARPVRMLQAHAHEAARSRCPLPRLPDSADSAPAEARRPLRWPSARASAPPRLFCLTACALLPRCRQPQLRAVGLDGHRALDISATTGRRDVDTTVTRIRPSSRPRALPHGSGGARPVPVKPVPVSRARSSSRERPRRRTARPAHLRVRPRRLRPGHRRHDGHSKHHRGLHAGAVYRHGSTTSRPLARRQPTLIRVALTCIYTAHHHMLTSPPATLAARFHSNARAPAHTCLVPARSPRKTRPSRRPPRLVRPLVRPTSFMRTTPPRPPPAKALRAMSR